MGDGPAPRSQDGAGLFGLWRLDGGCRGCGFFRGALFPELRQLPLVLFLERYRFAWVDALREVDALPPQHMQRPARDLFIQPEVGAELPPFPLQRDLSF